MSFARLHFGNPCNLLQTLVCGEEPLTVQRAQTLPRPTQMTGRVKRQEPLYPRTVPGQGGLLTGKKLGKKLSALGLGLGVLGLGIGAAEKLKGKVGKPVGGTAGLGGGIKAVGLGLGALGLGIKAVEHIKVEKKRRNRGRGLLPRQFGHHSGPQRHRGHSVRAHHGLARGSQRLQRRPGAFRRTSVLDYYTDGQVEDYPVYDDYGDYRIPRTRTDNLFL